MKTSIKLMVAATLAICAASSTMCEAAPAKKEALTIPNKRHADSIDFSNAPRRVTDKYPLSDQENHGGWKLSKGSEEFNGKKLDLDKWYPTNPKWAGRQPTQFHEANVKIKGGFAEFHINQHGDDKLKEGYTHSAGFLVSRERYKYGYFEARLKPNDSPWVAGFWMSYAEPELRTEIDICENCPGVEANRHDLGSNVHVFYAPGVTEHFDMGKKYYVPFELQKDFHTWGCEWDEDYIRFYIDGVMYREVENVYLHQGLRINLNNESNKWFGALPGEGNDKVDEIYLVDYVRIWQKE